MPRISKKSQVKQSHAVSTVSFQAHAFSDGESIHLKLPGGLIRPRTQGNPAVTLISMPRAGAPFRIDAAHPLLSTTQFWH